MYFLQNSAAETLLAAMSKSVISCFQLLKSMSESKSNSRKGSCASLPQLERSARCCYMKHLEVVSCVTVLAKGFCACSIHFHSLDTNVSTTQSPSTSDFDVPSQSTCFSAAFFSLSYLTAKTSVQTADPSPFHRSQIDPVQLQSSWL